MEKKRKLGDIVKTAGVGLITTVAGIEVFNEGIDIGNKIAPYIEKYVGLIGSGAVE